MSEDAEKLNKLVVMPESVVDIEKTTPLDSVRAITSFVRAKTQESQKAVEATSAISFMANNLQNRQLVTEFSVSVAKFYNDLGVNSEAACRQKLEELAITDHEMAPLLKELTDAWKDWETFLEGIDRAVEEVVGSNSPKSISSADNIKVATKKGSVQQGTLLSYVQNSPFQLMLIEIVLSFTANNCADHVLKMYEKLAAFQALNCDILLLTKSSGGDGGGFLKLVGVPFKLLLDEEQSLARILQHRQSAVSIASQKIINLALESIADTCGEPLVDGKLLNPTIYRLTRLKYTTHHQRSDDSDEDSDEDYWFGRHLAAIYFKLLPLDEYERAEAFEKLDHLIANNQISDKSALCLIKHELGDITMKRDNNDEFCIPKNLFLAEISCTGATIDTDQTQTTGFDKNGVEKNKKDDANSIKQTNGTLETGKETKETTVTVGKRRCCTIM
ncbi:hypothetical protein M3Y95_01119100 [Aphelenchoides besseyi]|nr:hypothetical protein M3Y95_01119100 [Aphelenchoides besseyi]